MNNEIKAKCNILYGKATTKTIREKKLLNQIELLETELTDLKADIIRLYNTMMALESINKLELYKDVKNFKNDDIEEL